MFRFNGTIFNANNIVLAKKVIFDDEKSGKQFPGIQIETMVGPINYSFQSEEERNAQFNELARNLEIEVK